MSTPLLQTRGLGRSFGALVAVDDVSFTVMPGQIHAVIGPNGAGKTTLFNVISGLVPASTGELMFDGQAITALPPFRRAETGISRTFQNIRIFPEMSVLENVMTGMTPHLKASLLGVLFRLPAARREEAQSQQEAHRLLVRGLWRSAPSGNRPCAGGASQAAPAR
jgi:branched-chain amino acid transport system ATP-binding protein